MLANETHAIYGANIYPAVLFILKKDHAVAMITASMSKISTEALIMMKIHKNFEMQSFHFIITSPNLW